MDKALLSQYVGNYLPIINRHKPIMVTGSHRSGTTWVGTVLAQSPDVSFVYEPFNSEFGYPLEDTYCKVCGQQVEHRYIYLPNEDETGFYKHVKHLVNSKNIINKRALFKSPFGLFATEWLVANFEFEPVVMIREPLGFVSSVVVKGEDWITEFKDLKKQEDLMSTYLYKYEKEIDMAINDELDFIGKCILMYNCFYSVVAEYRNKYPDWIYVTHEDLCDDTINGYQEIFNKLELTFDSSIENFIQSTSNSKNKVAEETDLVHAITRNSSKVSSLWKDRLDEDQVRRVNEGCDEVRSNFYE